MSTATTVLNNGVELFTNFDTSKIFLAENKWIKGSFTAGAANAVPGLVVGRIAATGVLVPMTSGASDGSQFPVGILNADVLATVTADVNVCVGGEVALEKVVLTGSDTLETIVSLKRIKDRIAGDTVGIVLVAGTELTGYDNQ